MDDYLKNVHTSKEIYDVTGIQLMNFNTLFQLYAMRRENNAALQHAQRILFMPDALSWMLTGRTVCEYTIASTSQLLNPRTREFDAGLLHSVGLTREHFGPMVMPGTTIGTLTEEVQRMTGLGAVPVIAVAGHDTGSAVAAVPALDEDFAYLSSGTWSLMGVETRSPIITAESYDRNFTNEGGIEGTVRFLKNICGMWLLERCRKECTEFPADYEVLFENAMKAKPFACLVNPDDPAFAYPSSMVDAIQAYCRKTGQHVPTGYAELTRCILDSLALRYRQVFGLMAEMAPHPISRLHIIGGGSRNAYLNQFTANATGVEVVAGPAEGTALGNIMVQAKARGAVKDIRQLRAIVAESLDLQHFQPQDKASWDVAYSKFLHITNQ
jgi:rhamnulokinase